MGWKLLYIIIAWPTIGVIEALSLIIKAAVWAHDGLVHFGVRLTKWARSKAP